MQSTGDPTSEEHHGGSGQRERQYIGQQHRQAIACEAANEIVPHEKPHDIEQSERYDHATDAIGHKQKHQHNLAEAKSQRAPHIDVGTATADDEVGEHQAEWCHSPSHAKHLQIAGTGEPLGGDGQHDELLGNERKAQQQGKRDERREAYQLAKGPQLALTIAFKVDKHGLCNGLHHALKGVRGLVVPLIGLVVLSCLVG